MVQQAELHRDLGVDEQPDDFGEFMLEIDGYLCEIKDAQIKDGLHTLGQPPTAEQMVGLLCALTRLDNGAVPSLRRSLAEALGYDYYALLEDPAAAVNGSTPSALRNTNSDTPIRNAGDVIEALESLCRGAYQQLCDDGFAAHLIPTVVADTLGKPDARTESVLAYVGQHIYPSLLRTTDEIDNCCAASRAGSYRRGLPARQPGAWSTFCPPGATSTRWTLGRCPRPPRGTWASPWVMLCCKSTSMRRGGYPEMVGVVVWGTSAMRTHGDDIAQILYLLGVKPVWQAESRRVSSLEVIPVSDLGRPRIDVTVRISGFFRMLSPTSST